MNLMFISWDGPQVSYLESLFLPIFQGLRAYGVNTHVLHFTWADDERVETYKNACQRYSCGYTSVSVLRKPVALGAFLTAVMSFRLIRKLVHKHDIDVIMPRSTLPALATLIAIRRLKVKLVFDADGLPIDERVDFAGQSPSSIAQRIQRDVEAQAVRFADIVLTRSYKAIPILQARAGSGTDSNKFYVVGNGRDATVFCPGSEDARLSVRRSLSIGPEAPLIVYAGSLGPQYCPNEMLLLFELVKKYRSDAHLLVLTSSPIPLYKTLESHPDLQESVTSMSVPPSDVASYLAASDLGLALRKRSFSTQAVAPIKLGEYLLCGLPLVATRDVGDSHVVELQSGYLLNDHEQSSLDAAARWFISQVLPGRDAFRSQCRSAGMRYFSLDSSIKSYWSALQSIGLADE